MRAVLLGLLVAALILVPCAQAHANFVASQPGPGARLAAAPSSVSVTVSQDVDPAGSSLIVRDMTGRRVDRDDLHVQEGRAPRLVVSLESNLTEGVYRVEWKALSRVDHHTTQEAFAFAVGNFSAAGNAPSGQGRPEILSVIGRAAFFAGFFLTTAGLLFARVVSPGTATGSWARAQRMGSLGLVGGCLILLVTAAARSGVPMARWLDSVVLAQLVARLAVAVVLAGILHAPARDGLRSVVAVLGLAVMAGLSSLSGHASPTGALAVLLDALHLVATAAWVGGLALFAYLLFHNRRLGATRDVLRRMGRRFSRAALVSVVTMAATGALLAATILGWPKQSVPLAWFEGPYGVALLGKIVLALAMIVLAAFNRFLFLRRLEAPTALGLGGEPRRFGLFVTAEAGIGVVVLVLAAILTAASPPFASSDATIQVLGEGEEFDVRMVGARAPQAGAYSELRFEITWREDGSKIVSDTCGRPRGCVVLEIVPPNATHRDEDPDDVHHGGEHRVMQPTGDGWWTVRDLLFAEPGEYELLVEIQTEYVFLDVVALRLLVEGVDDHAGHAS